MAESKRVKMFVDALAIDSVSKAPVVILKEVDGTRNLHIWIGALEAHAIAMEIEDIHPPRPMTHDLMINIMKTLGSTLRAIFINDLKGDTFFALLEVVTTLGEELEVDARPSDAIALALRYKAEIMVSESVLDNAKPAEVVDEQTADGADEVKRWLQDLKPEDFGSMEQ